MILNRAEILERNRGYQVLTADDIANGKDTNWWELEISGTIKNISPSVWKLTHLTALYLNDNSLSSVPAEIGLLVNLRRLDLSCNKLRTVPPELGDLVQLRELMLAHNYLWSLPWELGKLFQLMILGLKGNPLPPEIIALHSEPNGTRKLVEYLLNNLDVTQNSPPQRPWIQLSQYDKTKPTSIFTVMCYNVLCERYATKQMYGYCPQWALSWDYRKKGILDEVRHYGADIISLQEVETDQFYNFFVPELRKDGYEGVFSPKSRAKTMTESERKHVDGCAIFYRTQKFRLIKEHCVEFSQVSMRNADGCDVMMNRVMTKDNIALAVLLETREAAWETMPSQPDQIHQALLVATAHIHWDPEFCDVKLIQTMMLVDQLKRIIQDSSLCFRPGHKIDPSSIQLLLCGDLNSLPNSGVVEFLSKGRIPADHPEFKNLPYRKCLMKMLSHSSSEDEYTHPFKLASAVSHETMPFTNYTFDFRGVIDYIFYDTKHLQPLGVLGPVSEEWMAENKIVGCPHPQQHSDHFSLLVELCMNLPNLTAAPSAPQQIMQTGPSNNHLVPHGPSAGGGGGGYNSMGYNRINRSAGPMTGNRMGNHGNPYNHQAMMLGGLPFVGNSQSGSGSSGMNNGHPYSMMSYLHQNGSSSNGHSNMLHNNGGLHR